MSELGGEARRNQKCGKLLSVGAERAHGEGVGRWTHELRPERAATWAARGLRGVRGCTPRQHREQRKAMQ
eukprot:6186780-Pleurochrysis_carterae.AAC.1